MLLDMLHFNKDLASTFGIANKSAWNFQSPGLSNLYNHLKENNFSKIHIY
jgi:hypothetical protein